MPGSSQNGRFQEEMGGRDLSSQSGSLPLKTGELQHMRSNFGIHIGIFIKNLKFGHVSLKTGDFEIKREDGRQPLKTGVSRSKREGWNIWSRLFHVFSWFCFPCFCCETSTPKGNRRTAKL